MTCCRRQAPRALAFALAITFVAGLAHAAPAVPRVTPTSTPLLRERPDSSSIRRAPVRPAAAEDRIPTFTHFVQQSHAAGDSIELVDDRRVRYQLLESVTRLGELEAELDLLERTLDAQRARLDVLETDLRRPTTSLQVLVSGTPAAEVTTLRVRLADGSLHAVTLTEADREALAHGGILEVFQGRVDPHEQVIEIGLEGGGHAAVGFLRLEPPRDRTTLLRLEVANAQLEPGLPGARVTFWLHEPLSLPRTD